MLVTQNFKTLSGEKISCPFVLGSKSSTNITQSQHHKITNRLIFKKHINQIALLSSLTTKKISNCNILPSSLLYWCLNFTVLHKHFAKQAHIIPHINFLSSIFSPNIVHKSKNPWFINTDIHYIKKTFSQIYFFPIWNLGDISFPCC